MSTLRFWEVWYNYLICILLICIIYAKYWLFRNITCLNVGIMPTHSHQSVKQVVHYSVLCICFKKMYSNHAIWAAEFFRICGFRDDPPFNRNLWISCNWLVEYQVVFQIKHVMYQNKAYDEYITYICYLSHIAHLHIAHLHNLCKILTFSEEDCLNLGIFPT